MSERNRIRGVKRKRQGDKDLEEDKEAKLHRKLHHGLRELRKVVKRAKTFEVQKTLRKLKDARHQNSDSDSTRDLESQMEILKRLTYDQLAHSALMTKLKKNKVLCEDPSIRVILAELAPNAVTPGTSGTLTAKVQSRILSSKVIASEVVLIVENLRTILHPSVGSENTGEATQNLLLPLKISKRKRLAEDKIFDLGNNDMCEDADSDETTAEIDDGGWESGTVGGPSGLDSETGSNHDEVTFGPGSSDSDEPAEKPRSHESNGQSEFLPCLAVGFTRGVSDSEISDCEVRLVDGIKKNRRGQRARRAIWEKKFGKNANHMKKQRGQADTSAHRLADRRSGKGNAMSWRRPTSVRTADEHRQVRRPSGPVNEARRKERQDKPIHPSWEAKRNNKAASIVPSQGTKIVFTEP